MKTIITEFISLDGVVQAPGGASEDTDGGFSHGGWFMEYFDPEVVRGRSASILNAPVELPPHCQVPLLHCIRPALIRAVFSVDASAVDAP